MRRHISQEHFVRVWNECETLDAVCERLGVSRSYAKSRAMKERAKGLELRPFAPLRSVA